MNRMVRFAIRLYPAWWRRRYGTELQALVEDSGETWWTVLDLAKGALIMQLGNLLSPWSLARSVVACGLLGAFTGALVVFATPARYASTMSIAIQADNQTPSTDPAVIASLAFSDENLDRLVERFALYASPQNGQRMSDAIRRFRADISVKLTAPAAPVRTEQLNFSQSSVVLRDQGVLHVSFRYPDGHKAQKVTAELAGLIIHERLRQREAEEPSRVSRHGERYRVASPPNQVAAGPNVMGATSLGLGAGVLAGIGIATLRRRVQTFSKSK